MIMLEDSGDHPRTKKRIRLTVKLLAKKGIKSTFIPIRGASVLEKVFSTLLLGDWMAYYTATLRGVNPTPIAMVEKFKRLMK